jgi:hypothetical protein
VAEARGAPGAERAVHGAGLIGDRRQHLRAAAQLGARLLDRLAQARRGLAGRREQPHARR